ncbi:G patch domain-containing protein 4-like isoform X1 [Coturnix japonica]|uniref:G patch domain-containing protein 4 n=1 Tax=Coturnix japonica TaxID=93934 RepID=A0A8C2YCV5_COTJA|nr:G patch domain-containing protein 4-like isoform X1 [Coturnix japonica]
MSAAEPMGTGTGTGTGTGGEMGAGMRFAERQLRRHGWTRGRGLGKREDGIERPIRTSVKCGTAGVGHSAAEQFSFHWWDHVFNEAAANIDVRDGQDGVSVESRSGPHFGVSTKKPRKAPPPGCTLYGRFVKAATLTAHGEEPTEPRLGSESSEEEEDEWDRSSARRLTDEELVRVCGGRTAHKGARHGLTMSAKLARLEQQERDFMAARMQRGGGQNGTPQGSTREQLQDGRRRRRKKEEKEQSADGAEDGLKGREEEEEEEEEERTERRKKKKKERERSVHGADVDGLQGWEEEEEERTERRKKKKKRRKEELDGMEDPAEDTGGMGGAEDSNGGRKKKKKRRREDE